MKLIPTFKLPQFRLRPGVIVFFWVMLIFSLMAFVDKRQSKRVCQQVRVNIENEHDNYFIEEEDVNKLMTKNDKEGLVGESHQFIELKELEKRVKAHGFVEKVIVCKDLKGNIDVKVTQYHPIARLSLSNGNDKYISSSGKILPVSDRFTARVILLDGPFNNKLVQKDWLKDSLRTPYFEFINKIVDDEFLNVMVATATINRYGEINIYPQLGRQVIEFGVPEKLDTKFAMMNAFYKKIVPAKGWNRYHRVCVKFDNQIICE